MREGERKAFGELLQGVYALYRVDLSEAVLGIWWAAMQVFDLAAVREAMARHAMNPDSGQFLPKPADVVKLLGGSSLDAAQLAWAKVRRAVAQCGAYRSVCFDDPIIHAVLADMGGWVAVCAKQEDEDGFSLNEFATRYRGYRTRGGASTFPRYLPGIADGYNRATGFEPEPPLLVGDPERAAQVMRGGADSAALPVTPARLLASGGHQ